MQVSRVDAAPHDRPCTGIAHMHKGSRLFSLRGVLLLTSGECCAEGEHERGGHSHGQGAGLERH